MTAQRAALFVFGAAVALAFWPGTLEAAFTARWIVMAVGACLLLLTFNKATPMPLGGWGVALLLLSCATSWWAPDQLAGAEEAQHLLILGAVFCLGAALRDLGPVWYGLAAGVWVSAALAVGQYFYGWDLVEQARPPAGLFMNRNVLAEAALVALIPMLLRRNWLWAIGPAVAMALGASRGAAGAALVVLGLYLVRRDVLAGWGILAGIAVVGSIAFAIGDPTAIERAGFWRDALQHIYLQGNGLGAFATDYPYAEFAHNEYVQALYELGVALSVALGALLIYLLRGDEGHEESKLQLAGVLALGMLSFPFHMPVTAFAAALAAGHLAGARALVRDFDGRLSGADREWDGWKGTDARAADGDHRPGGSLEPDIEAHPATGRRVAQSGGPRTA